MVPSMVTYGLMTLNSLRGPQVLHLPLRRQSLHRLRLRHLPQLARQSLKRKTWRQKPPARESPAAGIFTPTVISETPLTSPQPPLTVSRSAPTALTPEERGPRWKCLPTIFQSAELQ